MLNPFRHWRAKQSAPAVSAASSVPEPAEVIRGLRQQVLTLVPEQIGVAPTPEHPRVWGVLMETGYPEALATLVSLADGTTSLYLGHGGGVIGAGEHTDVRKAAEQWLLQAEQHVGQLAPTEEFSLPPVGSVRFHLLTFTGARSGMGVEEELGSGGHELSPLFFAGHQVLSEVRKASERPRAQPSDAGDEGPGTVSPKR